MGELVCESRNACARASCVYDGLATDCTCPTGEVAVSGGGFCGDGKYLVDSKNEGADLALPKPNDVWRTDCETTAATHVPIQYAFALCARIKSS